MPESPSLQLEYPAVPKRTAAFDVAVSVTAAGLIGVSWTLWTPQTVFPQVPLFSATTWPDAASWAILLVLLGGLLVAAVQGIRGAASRMGAVVCLAAMGLLILEDQHRLQAWVIHLLWLWFILAAVRAESIPRLVLGLTVSIYFWSAASKLNPAFAEQHGRVLLDGVAKVAGIDIKRWPAAVLERLPYALPGVELLAAAGLAWRKTRTAAAWLAVLMHLVLFATFSPLGLNHAYGVLVWNGLFAVQALLFWCFPARKRLRTDDGDAARRLSAWERCLLVVVLMLPAGRLWGVVDQWAGWSLYSPRTEVIRIHLARTPKSIDPEFPDFTSRPYQVIHADFRPVEIIPDRWSLAVLEVPLNPESRLELAVAMALCERFDCWDAVSVERERRSLFSERTQRKTFAGREEILALAGRYWLNVRAGRRYVGRPASTGGTE